VRIRAGAISDGRPYRDPLIAEGLRSADHNAIHIRDYNMQKQRATDLEVFARAAEEGRIVVSADTDFGTLLASATKKGRLSFCFDVAPNVSRFNGNCR
jgi:predicted nuclease of predicted toxin-antitoxin system